MLENGGDDVLLALCAKASCDAFNSPVVSFRAAAGEENLSGETAENFGDLASCIFNGTSCVTSQSVDAGGVAELLFQIWEHCVQHAFRYLSCGGVIGIYKTVCHKRIFLSECDDEHNILIYYIPVQCEIQVYLTNFIDLHIFMV